MGVTASKPRNLGDQTRATESGVSDPPLSASRWWDGGSWWR